MADSPRKRYSRSPSPWEEKSRSRSRSPTRSQSRPRGRSRSRSHGRAEETNPGNTLYVTGLSSRVTQRDLEEHFSKEGKVKSAFLVEEPRSRISRGFAFITMDSLEDANRCIKHLNQSVLEGRSITVEKSRRKRPRTPTPGHYLGLHQSGRGDGYHGDRGRYRGRGDYGYRRSPRRSPYRGGRDYSPRRSPYAEGRDVRDPGHILLMKGTTLVVIDKGVSQGTCGFLLSNENCL
ncbi:LOW QUALITY PROTEIN: serine/arginine-rich splicing factor SR45a [Solanum tuberosum]|uniref:LOW QUALITY PROTEIN: serine/arginine-rich splicing factor SR45a n=1 Tax=Solanum tuberosum TaxID=4113 RepID=UPI00073A4EB6|nr:PREDICTED: LOW QUALITY PROTEIN: serine/arginine-rich splicing factor SR45a [Solanum tuberosum]